MILMNTLFCLNTTVFSVLLILIYIIFNIIINEGPKSDSLKSIHGMIAQRGRPEVSQAFFDHF